MQWQACFTYSPNWYDRNSMAVLPDRLVFATNADIATVAFKNKAVTGLLYLRKHIRQKDLKKVNSLSRASSLGPFCYWFGGSLGYFGVLNLEGPAAELVKYYRLQSGEQILYVHQVRQKVVLVWTVFRLLLVEIGDTLVEREWLRLQSKPVRIRTVQSSVYFANYQALFVVDAEEPRIVMSSEEGSKILDFGLSGSNLVLLQRCKGRTRLRECNLAGQAATLRVCELQFSHKQNSDLLRKSCLTICLSGSRLVLTGREGELFLLSLPLEKESLRLSGEDLAVGRVPDSRHYRQIYNLVEWRDAQGKEFMLAVSTDRKLSCWGLSDFMFRWEIKFMSGRVKSLDQDGLGNVYLLTSDDTIRSFRPGELLEHNHSYSVQWYKGLSGKRFQRIWHLRGSDHMLLASESTVVLYSFSDNCPVFSLDVPDLLWGGLPSREQLSGFEEVRKVVARKAEWPKQGVLLRCKEKSIWVTQRSISERGEEQLHGYKRISRVEVEVVWHMENYVEVRKEGRAISVIKGSAEITDLDALQLPEMLLLVYGLGNSLILKKVLVKGEAVFQKEIDRVDFASKVLKVRWSECEGKLSIAALTCSRESINLVFYNENMQRQNFKLKGHFGSVLDFECVGGRLVSCGIDFSVKSWDMAIEPKPRKKKNKKKGKREERKEEQEEPQEGELSDSKEQDNE